MHMPAIDQIVIVLCLIAANEVRLRSVRRRLATVTRITERASVRRARATIRNMRDA